MTDKQPDPRLDATAFRLWLNDRSISLNIRIYAVVRLVPPGFVTTYGDVGKVMGTAGLARQVGWALSSLTPNERPVPWQRVINRHGMVSYRGQLDRAQDQQAILEAEGIDFDEKGRCDLELFRYHYQGLLE